MYEILLERKKEERIIKTHYPTRQIEPSETCQGTGVRNMGISHSALFVFSVRMNLEFAKTATAGLKLWSSPYLSYIPLEDKLFLTERTLVYTASSRKLPFASGQGTVTHSRFVLKVQPMGEDKML